MDIENIETKICNICHKEKLTSDFSFIKLRNRRMNYCKTCNNTKYSKYRKNKDYKTYHKNYQMTQKYKRMLRDCRQSETGKKKHRDDSRRYRERLKIELLHYYSNGQMKCCKCPYDNPKALSIDHINGKGNKHRKGIGNNGSIGFYTWLRKNNFPDGFQVLCMNCQFEKKIDNNECNRI